MAKLTEKQANFVKAYVETGNATEAYRRSYDCSRMKPATIGQMAHDMTKHPKISAIISDLQKTRLDDVVMSAKDVVRNWILIASADPRELINHRRVNCRHCWGVAHKYQWRDDDELNEEIARAIDWNATCNARNKKPRKEVPDGAGGLGFKSNRAPHPDCPRCHGEGTGDVFVSDFNNLSPAAAALYNGVKVTKDGIEVKMRDRDQALLNLAKWLGVHKPDTTNVTVNNGPVVTTPQEVLPTDPIELAKFYKEFISKT